MEQKSEPFCGMVFTAIFLPRPNVRFLSSTVELHLMCYISALQMPPLCIELSNIHIIKTLEDKSIFSASQDTFSRLFPPALKQALLPSLSTASLNLSLIIEGFSFVSSLLYLSKRQE